ncbi:hypothetical protein CVIRNUC_006412 [Coccomyxa viridis]|uniref:ShKT domain-containing protein n=1 Tax=Coccomyxa viridis TaxID=1274662 RepID=A0AAV1I797_9CHLO|nr:hypothetical protein CVIRNUC_006412 [Coccomyxa viridis]
MDMSSKARTSALPLTIAALMISTAAAGYSIHTVVSTQCTDAIYFEWQVFGLAYSFRRAGQPGRLTRLLSCSEEKLREYRWLGIMPTFVVPDIEYDEEQDDHYTAYNKPFSIATWLKVEKPREDYIMVIDADSILRKPFLPEELHLKLGQAHTPYHFEIMAGVNNQLAEKHVPYVVPRRDWLAGPEGRKADRVGPPYIMHREDLETVAPLWYHFTREVRNDPEAWKLTGDGSGGSAGSRSWISEMYGYSFAAATADVWHQQVDYTANLVPGYGPIGPPKVLHYGNDLGVNNITYYEFDKVKLKERGFNPLECPPWKKEEGKFMSGVLPFPPSPMSFESKGLNLLRDLLAIEPAIVLNAAFCERHLRKCPAHEHLQACEKVAEQEKQLDAAYDGLEGELRKVPCKNWHKECDDWGKENYCNSNPRFMWYACRKTCSSCFRPDLQVRWRGGLNASRLAGARARSRCHELRMEELLAGDYHLDYNPEGLGEAEDPCEEAEEQARAAAAAAARDVTDAGGAAAARTAGAVPGAGKGEVQKRPENWVLPHESLVPELVIQMKESLPLSRRLRVNVAGVSAAAHALPRGAARSSSSVPAFVAFLDWFGVLAMWACVVGLFLMCWRRLFGRSMFGGRGMGQALPIKHT